MIYMLSSSLQKQTAKKKKKKGDKDLVRSINIIYK